MLLPVLNIFNNFLLHLYGVGYFLYFHRNLSSDVLDLVLVGFIHGKYYLSLLFFLLVQVLNSSLNLPPVSHV